MYTIIRKLAMVCLAVVFSVLVYGCGGGGTDVAETPDGTDGTDGMVMTNPVDTDSLTAGLTIMPGTYSIQPGKTADAGDATFTCAAGELSCDVTVTVAEDGSTTVESTGGTATAMDSASATARLAVMAAEEERDAALAAAMAAEEERDAALAAAMAAEEETDAALEELRLANLRINASDVDLDELADNFMTIPEGVYIIQQGQNMDVGDANFSCPADAVDPCEVNVDEDVNVTSAGGMATAQNSMAAMTTMTAIVLSTALGMDPPEAGLMGPPDSIGVSRSPDGDTTITLTHVADTDAKYISGAVDTGHGIAGFAGWMGQTLKRDNSKAADTEADIDAVPADEMDEATFYTNIDPAKPGKLKFSKMVPAGVEEFAIAADLMIEDLAEDDTFRAELIRTDGSRIPGTFTCDAEPCDAVMIQSALVLGVTVLQSKTDVVAQWDFESDDNEKEGETPDADYMYYGYWLKSPVGDSSMEDYTFATFYGGNDEATFDNDDDNRTIYAMDANALTATYEGGAAGMYVSRELRLDEEQGLVDEFSPGTYGRFTANAELIAKFGPHMMQGVDMDDESNTLGGTISEFRDGDVDLGFEVTLERSPITTVSGLIPETDDADNVSAMFGGSGPGSGNWSAQFYGPNLDSTPTERELRSTPTGVAGQFDAVTDNTMATVGDDPYTYHSRVVGVFAAEKK